MNLGCHILHHGCRKRLPDAKDLREIVHRNTFNLSSTGDHSADGPKNLTASRTRCRCFPGQARTCDASSSPIVLVSLCTAEQSNLRTFHDRRRARESCLRNITLADPIVWTTAEVAVVGAALPTLLASIGLLAGLAPFILSWTVLTHYLLDRATAVLQLQIRCGSISLGWLQPPELRDVQVYDSGTEVLLELRRLRIDRPLWRLLQNPYDLGHIELQQPVLHLRCYPGGSNLEDLVQRLPRTSGSSVGLPGDFTIRDGTLSVCDTLHDRCWKLTGWQAQLRLPAAGGQPVSLQTSLQADHAAGPSRLTARVGLTADTGTEGPIETKVQLQLQQFPAAVAQLMATRLAYDVALDGVLDGELKGRRRIGRSRGRHPTRTAS